MLLSALLILSFNLIISALQHEKSFMFDSTASSVYDIALYKRSLLITSSNDVVQKDIETGRFQRKFIAHAGLVQSIVVFNYSTMITSGWDDMVIVWDLISGSIMKRIWLEAPSTFPTSMALWNNDLIVCGHDGKVRFFNMLAGRVAHTINVNAEALVIVLKDDAFYVGKRGTTSQLEKYSSTTRSLQLAYEGHQDSVFAVFLWEDLIFSGSGDTKIICWNEGNGQIIRTFEAHTAAVLVISVFDSYLYSGGQKAEILKWNIDSGIVERTFPSLHGDTIWCFAFEVGTLYSGSTDSTVMRWDLNTSSSLFAYFDRKIRLRSVVLWKNVVIAGGGDNQALLIQDRSQNSVFPVEIMSGHKGEIASLIISEDTLFSGGEDKTIRRRSLIDYSELKIYYGHSAAVIALDLDEKYLYSGSYDFTAIRWNISSGTIEKHYVGHTSFMLSIQVGPALLFSGSLDFLVGVWNKEDATSVKFFRFSTEVNAVSIYNDDVLIVGTRGLDLVQISTGQVLARQTESFVCVTIVASTLRIYSGHADGLVRGRDPTALNVLESFQGHEDAVMSICLDDVGILFSTGLDGSVKKWNMASRRVSFSYENRNSSVTALATVGGILFVGTRQGLINLFEIGNACIMESTSNHKSTVTSLAHFEDTMYSSGVDGMVFGFRFADTLKVVKVYDTGSFPVRSMVVSILYLIAVKDETEIIILARNSTASVKKAFSPSPIISIAANDNMIFAGSRAGSIVAWSITSLQIMFSLEDHESQANSLLIADSNLYSASNDKSIIKWSLEQRTSSVYFRRLSAAALGHLGPVNSISVCGNTLFSAGSDLTTRRWNIYTGRHEDVYFGPAKSVTSVVCYNGSVFAGSEDFSVLMYNPALPVTVEAKTSARSSTSERRRVRTRKSLKISNSSLESPQTTILIGGIIAAMLLFAIVLFVIFYYSSKLKTDGVGKDLNTSKEFSESTTDLQTVVNTVIGISKHAAYLVANSSVASMKKLATGGGGEIFLARVMKSFLKEKTGSLVVQKIVFLSNQMAQEAFYQEVGIMIMLSSFPNFCRIVGYTENPVSMILQYYPDGSLQAWIQKNEFGREIIVKVSKEIASALNIMHSHYLAHCDIKTQNVLIELTDGVPTCYLTDFGITQVLSEKILATRSFNVINMRGLSVHYAAPEAFRWFRTKAYTGADFKKFDIYSLACILLELLTRKFPWA